MLAQFFAWSVSGFFFLVLLFYANATVVPGGELWFLLFEGTLLLVASAFGLIAHALRQAAPSSWANQSLLVRWLLFVPVLGVTWIVVAWITLVSQHFRL